MAKIPQNSHLIDIVSSQRKADIKKISAELYSKNIISYPQTERHEIVLKVHFKNLVKAIFITSRIIEEDNLEVYLCNTKYWDTHVPEFCERRRGKEI